MCGSSAAIADKLRRSIYATTDVHRKWHIDNYCGQLAAELERGIFLWLLR
jgi:hypothetical protein